MDREKVIKEYEEFVDKYECFSSSDDYVLEMHKAVLALLKEREETTFKPHYIDEYGKHFICGVECGACHKEISSTYHYCPWCGRVVKWK